ncbi:hypothetical protein GCM10011507_16790 [Edaphobacter acidisoli]|uniref:Uncharacterized protein n=1 Tax=Edaphobacter acidisoli TaxID=2040573 RepID=A0A916W4Y3_9BACT|nr:hypothetical protein GCM10011507_16790 [Edaphobacter acidisoli]
MDGDFGSWRVDILLPPPVRKVPVRMGHPKVLGWGSEKDSWGRPPAFPTQRVGLGKKRIHGAPSTIEYHW